MTDRITPLMLDALMFHYYSGEPSDRTGNGPYMAAIDFWISEGALEKGGPAGYQCTDLGSAWVHAFLRTPKPRIAFLDARDGEEIIP